MSLLIIETGAKPSPGPRPLPRNNSSYHPDNPRRHESQLSTALVLCLRCVLFRVQSSATHQLRTHRKQHHLHLPIQRTSLSWVDWKKDSPTMRQHSSKQIDVHTAAATSFTTSQHTHSNEFVPLASPVESSEIRATCSARPSNIDHFSHQTLEQTTTSSSTRADLISSQHP